jgi:hypothetical protein
MILNLTQHVATEDQRQAGVVDLRSEVKADVVGMLTFNDIPTVELLWRRAESIAQIAKDEGYTEAMIGGAPFFMGPLEQALIKRGITPLYAFSRRESVDKVQADGNVKKVAIFKHLGFVGK